MGSMTRSLAVAALALALTASPALADEDGQMQDPEVEISRVNAAYLAVDLANPTGVQMPVEACSTYRVRKQVPVAQSARATTRSAPSRTVTVRKRDCKETVLAPYGSQTLRLRGNTARPLVQAVARWV